MTRDDQTLFAQIISLHRLLELTHLLLGKMGRGHAPNQVLIYEVKRESSN